MTNDMDSLECSLSGLSEEIKSLNEFIRSNKSSSEGTIHVFERLCVILNTASVTASFGEMAPQLKEELANQLQCNSISDERESQERQVLEAFFKSAIPFSDDLTHFRTTLDGSRANMDSEIEMLKKKINGLATKFDSICATPGGAESSSTSHVVGTIVGELKVLQDNMMLMKKRIEQADTTIEKTIADTGNNNEEASAIR